MQYIIWVISRVKLHKPDSKVSTCWKTNALLIFISVSLYEQLVPTSAEEKQGFLCLSPKTLVRWAGRSLDQHVWSNFFTWGECRISQAFNTEQQIELYFGTTSGTLSCGKVFTSGWIWKSPSTQQTQGFTTEFPQLTDEIYKELKCFYYFWCWTVPKFEIEKLMCSVTHQSSWFIKMASY